MKIRWCGPRKIKLINNIVPQFVFSNACKFHDYAYETLPGWHKMCIINIEFLFDLFREIRLYGKTYHYPLAILYFLIVIILSPVYYIIYLIIRIYAKKN